ncbi:MAG: S-methyl-5-thioribose-1-phosphate isomerase [Candidatus Aenigmarchaeota archaeon]|nr:S-methyl-5-thioribose-1-phosphate isomerase [Candidatus Aenigmarchaeota archaeon]
MRVGKKWYRSVWFSDNKICFIDQTKLPFEFEVREAKNYKEVVSAIKSMKIRGASAIGAAGAYGIAQAFALGDRNYVKRAKLALEKSRPTARDLTCATNAVFSRAKNDPKNAVREAEKFVNNTVENCKKIGEYGKRLIRKREKNGRGAVKVLTHCNAGWLASVDWGTSLSPIYMADKDGKNVFVYVSETRPRMQGAKLTAWELSNAGIKHEIICDSASAYFMSDVDLVIVGSDRIARNGDIANKIGTLEKAIVAKEYGVPFYVASSTNSFDAKCRTGRDIPIEQRDESEVLYVDGKRVADPKSGAENPAFDVTPAEFITAIITEKGIVKPKDIKRVCEYE